MTELFNTHPKQIRFNKFVIFFKLISVGNWRRGLPPHQQSSNQSKSWAHNLMYNYHNNNYRGLWHQLLTISCWHYDCQKKFDSETVVEESIYQCWLWNWLRIWSSHLSFSSGPINHTEVCHTRILESWECNTCKRLWGSKQKALWWCTTLLLNITTNKNIWLS